MRSNAGRGLIRALVPLRLYDLSEDSRVSAELSAYDAAFLVLEELLDQIRADAFVQTATGEALRRFERLVGLPERPDMDEQTRRELVIYRMSVAPYDFTAGKMLGSVRAAGIEARLTEDFANERLVVHSLGLIDPSLTIDIARERLRLLVPAHLDWDLDFGFTDWDAFASLDYSWSSLDALDCAWESLDLRIQGLLS